MRYLGHYNPVIFVALLVFASPCVMSGCAPPGNSGNAADSPSKAQDAQEPSATASPTNTPTVKVLGWDQTQKLREQFLGRVVILDVWSTYCDPCIREFPNLVALQRQQGSQVVCISFNTDYAGAKDEPAESFRPQVLKFLTKQRANLINVISGDPSEELYTRLKLGGPPAVYIYDRKGNLAKRFVESGAAKSGESTYKTEIIPFVEKLLAEPAP